MELQFFFKNLKKYNIKFKEPLSAKDSWTYTQTCHTGTFIPILSNSNYYIYKEMKKNSTKGVSPNLKKIRIE